MSGPLVVLVGPMGVGKSTVGQRLAERLGVSYRDTDEDVVAEQGRTIAEIFVDDGESAFRAIEARAVARALAGHDGVLALGGGAVLDPRTRALLSGLPVVFLDSDADEAVRRIGRDPGRPLLAGDPHRRWRALAAARRPLYTEVARAVVDTSGRTPEGVVEAVLAALAPRVTSA
ncbi:shikimate kinase [Streptomyces heilongjiangensis]|uniref:Shikimate kinase n=1 Tax=Streptomyces heilongjiangensis TaxID=945052 RepID=A0ABW1B3F8_9ACTN|nr:shikimate kinase [Streptomyces heilongjiangensis]MDC2945805.1 shikimate kinase [Streptomyces heilongjiangensis]